MNYTQLIEALKEQGIDTEHAVERFMGNQSLYLSFIQRLPTFINCEKIRSTLEQGDEDEFYMAVHSLDGVSGNLGLTTIFECCNAILVEFHSSKFKNPSKLLGLVQEIEQERDRILEFLSGITVSEK